MPRTGTVLAPNVPLDANDNPGGAELDPRRNAVSGGFRIQESYGVWSGLVSHAHSSTDVLRGFVTDPTGPVFPAIGERQTVAIDGVYADAHVELTNVAKTQMVAGVDYQDGRGHMNGGDFAYSIAADGSSPPDGTSIPLNSDANINDTMSLGGVLIRLQGKRQEMTPIRPPPKGFSAHGDTSFTGSRYLNKRNTAPAPQFTTWGVGIGWRGDRFTIRLDGTDLGAGRHPRE